MNRDDIIRMAREATDHLPDADSIRLQGIVLLALDAGEQAEPVGPVAALIAQHDALLEALKEVLAWGTDQNYVRAKAACDKARAAIKAVEEGK